MKKLLLLFVTSVLFSCGSYIYYAKVDVPPHFSIKGEKVALLGINIPVDIVEKNVSLKLVLYNDFLKILNHQEANVFRLQMPEEKNLQTKIYKNDLYNWFFRSDSFILESNKSKIDLSNLDYVIEINVLNYEKGMSKGNDWIDFSVLFYSAQTKKLIYTVSGRGFYSSVLQKMRNL